jgi:hypothetical protein
MLCNVNTPLWVARGTEMHAITSPNQTLSHLPVVQKTLTNEGLGTESQRYNCSTITGRGNAAEHARPKVDRWQPHHWTT